MAWKKSFKKEKYIPYALLAPAVAYYLLFWIRPIIAAFREGFTDLEGRFTLMNFRGVISDEVFGTAFANTFIFALISVIVQFALALSLAFLLNRKFKGVNLLLFAAMIPMAIPPLAVTILWKTGFTTYGWVNALLYSLGIIREPITWLSAEGMNAVFFLIGIDTWVVLPSVMIILLAGLQNLNKEYGEAARVYGASRWQVAKDIVIPIIKPTIMTAIILRIIASIQVWLISVTMFGYGRSPFLVERIAYYTEQVPLLPYSKKYAYAYSIFVTVIVLITSVIYLRVSRKSGAKGGRSAT